MSQWVLLLCWFDYGDSPISLFLSQVSSLPRSSWTRFVSPTHFWSVWLFSRVAWWRAPVHHSDTRALYLSSWIRSDQVNKLTNMFSNCFHSRKTVRGDNLWVTPTPHFYFYCIGNRSPRRRTFLFSLSMCSRDVPPLRECLCSYLTTTWNLPQWERLNRVTSSLVAPQTSPLPLPLLLSVNNSQKIHGIR